MRIVVDLQGAQTESKSRGIGRYSLAFARALVRNRRHHDVILALNGGFARQIEAIRAEFDGWLPAENLRVFDAPGPLHANQPANRSRIERAQLIREAFLADLKPDVVIVSSLFEGFIDDGL